MGEAGTVEPAAVVFRGGKGREGRSFAVGRFGATSLLLPAWLSRVRWVTR
jgi:hypothetical protein